MLISYLLDGDNPETLLTPPIQIPGKYAALV